VGRTIVLYIAVPIAIIAYAADVSDRLGWIKLTETGDVVTSWGVMNNEVTSRGVMNNDRVFYIAVNSRLLRDYQKDYKMMEIVQIQYTNIDRMTDTDIEKSVLYTITGDPMIVALTLSSPSHLRGSMPNAGIDKSELSTSFILVVVPGDLSPEQIRSLSDVDRLGGKIIGGGAANVVYGVHTGVGTPGKS